MKDIEGECPHRQASDVHTTPWRSEATWMRLLSSLSMDPSGVFHKSAYDPMIRTYLQGAYAHKIALKTDLPDLYPKLSPAGFEAALLRQCEGVPGVPAVRGFRETQAASVLSMNRIDGTTLQDALPELTIVEASHICARLLQTVLAISWRGVAHNDIVLRNVLVDQRNRPFLVDFDQAHRTSRIDALLRNVLGLRGGAPLLYGSWLLVAARLVFQFLPHRGTADMPILAADASKRQKKLVGAWKIAQRAGKKARGRPVACYSLLAEDMRLPGERPWEARWDLLRNAADFTGLRTLDLGCNMGLLSTWLLREAKAASALGIDSDPLILAAARQIADAFSVDASFEKVDLDAAYPWESRLDPSDFDLVFALDVLDLLRDRQRVMQFLGKFPIIVFQGREPDAVEIKRFSDAGFQNHRVLGAPEGECPVLVFSK